ncbi:hypothetical protein IEN85_10150 [Pelagicoccus sp. NFK12]|uniref:Lipoprotein n=1 Tax=Pelagicoccus enzymogenes TaxID=2773457 RepID=A0A927IHV3_9BACT|nr:hypothetical protein [Pelagicoccus enzymogenes]MBD5779850.1 hypothetical protein [Pelagicoccus enzymogenes]
MTKITATLSLLILSGCAHVIERVNIPFEASSLDCEQIDVTELKRYERKRKWKDFVEEAKRLLPIGSTEEEIVCFCEALEWSYVYSGPHNIYASWKDLKFTFPDSRVGFEYELDEDRKLKELTFDYQLAFL